MIFADAAIPAGVNDWLSSFFWLAGGCLVLLKIVDHFKEKPPMDKQVRDLEDRLNQKIDTEIDTVSTWVVNQGYASRTALETAIGGVREKIDEREVAAAEFRHGLKEDIRDLDRKLSERSGQIFDAIRSLGREVSHIDGKISRTQKLTITKEGA